MTIASEKGFVVGRMYEVVNSEGNRYIKNGEIVKFTRDDGSSNPWFTKDDASQVAVTLSRLKPFGKFKIGDKVVCVVENSVYHKKDSVHIVSDIAGNWIYINGDMSTSRNGFAPCNFELYVPAVKTDNILEEIQDVEITVKTGKVSMSMQGKLTAADLMEILKIMKKGK